MSNIRELLNTRRLECVEEMETLKEENRAICTVIAMLDADKKAPAPEKKTRRPRSRFKTPLKTMILKAIKHGCGKPSEIQTYISNKFSLEVASSSVSNALHVMKTAGEIDRDKHGRWVPPSEKPAATESPNQEVSNG